MRNPYFMDGPAILSISGGRTSGYMLERIIDAHDGRLPDDVVPAFANTGKERPETLDFVQELSSHFGVKIVWLEYRWDGERHTFEIVSHNSASRNGEPFQALLEKRSMLPNPVTRFCTSELKIRVLKKFAMSIGFEHWDNVVGMRYDEPSRVANLRAPNKERWENVLPLADAKVTELEVMEFWQRQPFDLRLRPHEGNCDLCFLKGRDKLECIMADRPDLADWWIAAEAGGDATFRDKRPVERILARAIDPDRRALLIKHTPTTEDYLEKLRAVPSEALQMFMFDSPDNLGDCMCNA